MNGYGETNKNQWTVMCMDSINDFGCASLDELSIWYIVLQSTIELYICTFSIVCTV